MQRLSAASICSPAAAEAPAPQVRRAGVWHSRQPAHQPLQLAGPPQRQLCLGCRAAVAVGSRRAVASRAAAVDELETAAPPAAVPARDGGVFIDGVSFEDGVYTVRGRLETAASPDLAYAALTDYEALPRVFHNVLESSVLDVKGRKHLVQTCKWAFLIFSGTFRTSLAVEEDPAARRLAFHLVQSSFMRQFVGRWEVQPAPQPPPVAAAGAEGFAEGFKAAPAQPARSVITHSLAVRPAVAPPAAVAHYTSKIFVQQVENILRDLQAELRRRMAEEQ